MSNIIRTVFSQNDYSATATRTDGKPILQYNYGQILQLHGLSLPKAAGADADKTASDCAETVLFLCKQ